MFNCHVGNSSPSGIPSSFFPGKIPSRIIIIIPPVFGKQRIRHRIIGKMGAVDPHPRGDPPVNPMRFWPQKNRPKN